MGNPIKKTLKVTSEELLALDLSSLRDVYKETSGTDADAALNEAELTEAILALATPKAAPAEKEKKTFSCKGKKYRMLIGKVFIPGLGERTAAEVLQDIAAQEYLVKENTIGSVIQEVK